jgi:hypothetical protein
MDSQTAQYLAAHIEAMREQTKSINLLTKALCEQVDVISQLVNAVGLLVDSCYQDEPDPEQEDMAVGEYLMDGTRVS